MSDLGTWSKIKLMLWKNCYLVWNDRLNFLTVFIFPIIFSILLIILRTQVHARLVPVGNFETINLENSWKNLLNVTGERKNILQKATPDSFSYSVFIPQHVICYAPEGHEGYDVIMKKVGKYLDDIKIIGFPDCRTLRHKMSEEFYLSGICFYNEELTTSNALPNQLNYSLIFPNEIRIMGETSIGSSWNTFNIYDPYASFEHRVSREEIGYMKYVDEGFLYLQQAVSLSYISSKTKNDIGSLPKILMRRFPIFAHYADHLQAGLDLTLSLIIILGYLYPVTHFAYCIVLENNTKISALLNISGIQYWIQYLTLSIVFFVIMFLSSIFIIFIVKIKWDGFRGIFADSQIIPLLSFLCSYNFATICFGFMLSAFFTSPKTVAPITCSLWIFSFLPFVNSWFYDTGRFFPTYGFSNCLLASGLQLILEWEIGSDGLSWNNFGMSFYGDGTETLSKCTKRLFCIGIAYLAIGIIVSRLFSMIKRKWVSYKQRKNRSSQRDSVGQPTEVFEVPAAYRNQLVEINNVSFINHNKHIVKDISFELNESEVTVIMGHNGCGKTTLMRMLSGLLPISKGTIIINGFDISDKEREARSQIGFALSDPLHYDNFKVRDCLYFTMRLKGVNEEDIETEINKYLEAMNLKDKKDSLTKRLTNGQRQHLSVCCALSGNSKFVVLENPERDMSVSSRNLLYELILKEKHGRAILLTTHSPETASAVADRLIIMSNGVLKAAGSTYLIKKLYGLGFRVKCMKGRDCDTELVNEVIRKYIPNTLPLSDVGTELVYILPERYREYFTELFNELDERKVELSIDGISLSDSPIEDTVLSIGSEHRSDGSSYPISQIKRGYSSYAEQYKNLKKVYLEKQISGIHLWYNQIWATLYKRHRYNIHYKFVYIFQILLPALFFLMLYISTMSKKTGRSVPLFEFSLSQYFETVSFMEQTSPHTKFSFLMAQKWYQLIREVGFEHNLYFLGENRLSDYMLTSQRKKKDKFHDYLLGATIDGSLLIAWFSNFPLHVPPLSLNNMHNAMLRALSNTANRIFVSNHPLPRRLEEYPSKYALPYNFGSSIATLLPFWTIAIWTMSILFIVKERQSKFKLLQFISGLRNSTFWVSTFIFDSITVLIVSIAISIGIYLSIQPISLQHNVLLAFFVILVLTGIVVISFNYFVSNFFNQDSNAYNFLTCLHFFGGVAFCAFYEVSINAYNKPLDIIPSLNSFFKIFPQFSLSSAFLKIYQYGRERCLCQDKQFKDMINYIDRCQNDLCCNDRDIWSGQSGIMSEIKALFIVGISSWILIYLTEKFKAFQKSNGKLYESDLPLKQFRNSRASKYLHLAYNSVLSEMERVQNMEPMELKNTALVLDGVCVNIGEESGINELYLVLEKSECFGILGPNESQKSNICKLIVGDVIPYMGKIKVFNLDIEKNLYEIYRQIGYSPENDPFIVEFSAVEILKIICLLRGIPKQEIVTNCECLAKMLGFYKHLNKSISKLSDGNIKRLSCASAMLANPSLIILDNPSTRMDFAGLRLLWDIICRMRTNDQSVIIASSNPNDFEPIYDRVTFLTKEHLLCINSPKNFKQAVSTAYFLNVKIRSHIWEELHHGRRRSSFKDPTIRMIHFVETSFPYSEMLLQLGSSLHFKLLDVTISEIYKNIEANSFQLNIEEYLITSATLDDACAYYAENDI